MNHEGLLDKVCFSITFVIVLHECDSTGSITMVITLTES